MDSITQFALGAVMGEAALGKKIGNKAILWGGLAGTIPDLDVLFFPFMDQVAQLSFHRGITHALIFSFIMAPMLGWLFARWYKGDASNTTFKDWFLLWFLGFFTHTLIDAFTVYGTQLLLPFTDTQVGFNNIFIADPLYTIPLLLSILICLFIKRHKPSRRFWNYMGIGISTAYILFTFFAKHQSNKVFEAALQQKNIPYTRFMTGPTPLNSIMWYSVAEVEDGYYMGLYSLLDKNKEVDFYYFERQDSLIADIKHEHAVERVLWFSNGYYIARKVNGKLTMYVLKFGKVLFYQPTEDFIFSFTFNRKENGELTFKEEHERPNMDMAAAFKMFWQRIKGDESMMLEENW